MRAQAIVGDDVTVVSAFQNVAADLMASDEEMACDVLVAGDKVAAREVVIELAEQAKFKAWHAGPLVNSTADELGGSGTVYKVWRFAARFIAPVGILFVLIKAVGILDWIVARLA